MTQKPVTRQGSILLLSDVETLLGTTSTTLRSYVSKGWLPRPRRLGKAIFWRRDELEACLVGAPVATSWTGLAADESPAPQEEVEAA